MSERALEKGAELRGLSTAILLPSIDLFGAQARAGTGPLTQIVGVGLFQRTVLTLQRAGIRQMIVLAGPEEDQLKLALGKGPRATIPVRWMPIREFPLDDPRTWEALAAEVRGFCLLSGVRGLFSRPLIEQLRREVKEGEAIVVSLKGRATGFQRAQAEAGAWSWEERRTALADVIVLPAALMGAAGRIAKGQGAVPVRWWLDHAAKDGRVRIFRTEENPAQWYQPIEQPSDLAAAEQKLFGSLKSEFEGFVDRYFNRRLSRWFTRVFLALGFSPNTITIVATFVGLLAAVAFAQGTYGAGLVGALLFQLAAVIDCCDGEVARLTFTESAFGAWLDIAMDNVVHIAIFGGIAAGAHMRSAGTEQAWVPLALGAVAIIGNAISFLLVNRAQKIKQASEWKTPVHAAWSDFMLKNVASRDFTVVVLAFALLGRLELFLWIAAIGSAAFALIMVWVVRPSGIVAIRS